MIVGYKVLSGMLLIAGLCMFAGFATLGIGVQGIQRMENLFVRLRRSRREVPRHSAEVIVLRRSTRELL